MEQAAADVATLVVSVAVVAVEVPDTTTSTTLVLVSVTTTNHRMYYDLFATTNEWRASQCCMPPQSNEIHLLPHTLGFQQS